jgi:hypothetical protein
MGDGNITAYLYKRLNGAYLHSSASGASEGIVKWICDYWKIVA